MGGNAPIEGGYRMPDYIERNLDSQLRSDLDLFPAVSSLESSSLCDLEIQPTNIAGSSGILRTPIVENGLIILSRNQVDKEILHRKNFHLN